MSLEDPFFVVKDEVLKALLKTRSLFERWQTTHLEAETRSPEELEWASTELRNALRSIEWDLEDLDDTVQIVEKNPAKFKMDPTELMVRKDFISQTREEVRLMKARHRKQVGLNSTADNDSDLEAVPLASPNGQPPGPGGGGIVSGSREYSRLPNAHDLDSPSHVSSSSNPTHVSQATHINILSSDAVNADEQAVMLDEFGAEIENAESKLDATMRKMSKMLNMSHDRKQWLLVGLLTSSALVILLLILSL